MSFASWMRTQSTETQQFFDKAATWARNWPTVSIQFKNHPEVLKILLFGSLEGLTQDQITDQLAQTAYYKKTTEAQRDMDVLAIQKPAEYQKVAKDKLSKMKKTIARLGLYISTGNKGLDTQNFLRDINEIVNNRLTDDQIADYLLTKYAPKVPSQATGAIRNSMNDVRKIARDFAMPLDDKTALKYGIALQTSGSETLDSVRGQVAKQARLLYNNSALNKAIDDGMTVREWADPYVQIAATTLEVGADTIDLSQGKWNKFLKVPKADATSAYGASFRTMTLSEWQATIRTDESYGFDKTENARQSASDLTAQLQEKFGVTG